MSLPESIAFQGTVGAFGEDAAIALNPDAARYGVAQFADVFEAVEFGHAAAGVIPIENSLGGSVLDNYDLLQASKLTVIGEIKLSIEHCLLGVPGARIADVRHVHSHPQALAQCRIWIAQHELMNPVSESNTAQAAADVARRADPAHAAIASRRAAAAHGLEVLAEGIQERDDNTTRFFVVARERPADLAIEKASVIFTAANRPGSLLSCLAAFAEHGLNLTKIESRPTKGTPWEYFFYADFTSADASQPLDESLALQALGRLTQHADLVQTLGMYPAAR